MARSNPRYKPVEGEIGLYMIFLLAILLAPFGLRSSRKARKRAAENQKLYKEMYRGKYGL